MERRINQVRVAATDVGTLQGHLDHAHGELVDAMCEAMAAGFPPDGVSEAAGMNVAELFDALRSDIALRNTLPPADSTGY